MDRMARRWRSVNGAYTVRFHRPVDVGAWTANVGVIGSIVALALMVVAALAVRSGVPLSPSAQRQSVPQAQTQALPQTQGTTSASSSKTGQHVTHAYGRLPLSFIPNRGQTDKGVRYYAQGAAHAFYFTRNKAVLAFTGKNQGFALDLTPLGANPASTLRGNARQEGKVNYLTASEHHTNLPTYAEVRYGELWPGVDMAFSGQGGRLKYELRLRPGADPSKIGLTYAGATNLSLTKSGALLIHTPLGTLRDSAPRTYQVINGRRVPVKSRFSLRDGNAYGFALGSYDPRRALVIDPGLFYSTFLGGSSGDALVGGGIAIDASGSAYVAGYTVSSNFPATVGAFDTSYNGGEDGFVTKLNAAGSALVYTTYLGGTSNEEGSGIAVDGGGSAYVTGETNSSDFPTTLGAFDTSYNGLFDAFVTKLNTSGSGLTYSTYLGGAEPEIGYGIAVDTSGSAYVIGNTQSSDFPASPGAFDTTYNGFWDAFVTKLNTSGSGLMYSTYLGGTPSNDQGFGIVVDGAGGAYVTGQTDATNFPTTVGAFDTSYNGAGSGDAFVTKLNAEGAALAYSTYLGGSLDDAGQAIAVDASGGAYVTGYTQSSDFPISAGAFDTTFNGGQTDAFVTKLNAAGTVLAYSTYLGGSSDDTGKAIGMHVRSAYVTGSTPSSDFPTTAGAFDTSYNGNGDAFVTRMNAAGSGLAYSTYLGGATDDTGVGIAADAGGGGAYVTGETTSAGFPTTAGAFDTSYNGGGGDAFVTKLDGHVYDSPRHADTFHVSLAPNFRQTISGTQCTSRGGLSSTHGPPLSLLSCNPPAFGPGTQAHIGNKATSGADITVIPGDSDPDNGNQADVALSESVTDLRQGTAGGPDYNPVAVGQDMTSVAKLRISDLFNTTAGQPCAAGTSCAGTVVDFDFTAPVSCAATADPTIGASCGLNMTANAIVPNLVQEQRNTVVQVFRLRVKDAGANGTPGDTDDRDALMQGIYVP